jgi:hypothetical protein
MEPFSITIMWAIDRDRPERTSVWLNRPGRYMQDLATFADPYEAAGYVKRWFDGRGIRFTSDINEAQRKDAIAVHFWPADQLEPIG